MRLRWTFWALALAGCATDATGVLLTVESDGSLDQVVVASEGLSAVTLPEPARSLGVSETVTVLVPGSFDGASLTVAVEGLRGGAVVANDAGTVTIVRGTFVPLTVSLVACDPACAAGEVCRAGVCECDPATCGGCCGLTGCVAGDSTNECGAMGASCATCEPTEACEDGACAPCGDACLCGGESCDPERTDRCERGACSCGGGPPCLVAETCSGGACVCGGLTCRLGTECEPANRLESCGPPGGACAVCEPGLTDACVEGECRCGAGGPCQDGEVCVGGECRCGDGPGCAEGQRCNAGGSCVCDGRSCAGCCEGGMCFTGTNEAQCGGEGEACESCGGGERCVARECD